MNTTNEPVEVGDNLDTLVDKWIPHYGHQYCQSPCPNFLAKAELTSLINQTVSKELEKRSKIAHEHHDYLLPGTTALDRLAKWRGKQ